MNKTKELVLTGLLSAIIFISLLLFKFQPALTTNGGLVHLGTLAMVIINIIFGRKQCALSAAIGMTLFDFLSGYANWAIPTFIIRFAMGHIMGYISYFKEDGENYFYNILSVIISGIFMVLGYYLAGSIMYGNFIVSLESVPYDIVQVLIGVIVGIPLGLRLKKIINIKQS